MAIDHEAEEPLYLQVAAVLRAQIEDGTLQPNRPIPSERTICEQFGIARGTASKAVRVLRDAGWVRLRFGRGTFVVPEDERPSG